VTSGDSNLTKVVGQKIQIQLDLGDHMILSTAAHSST